MGDGLDRAGYKQIARNVDAVLITSTMGNTTGDWAGFEVVSSKVQLKNITAPGMRNSSLITSGTTYHLGAFFGCSRFTRVAVADSGAVVAYNRILM